MHNHITDIGLGNAQEGTKKEENFFIVNPLYDSVFFIFAPLIALFLGIAISGTPISNNEITILGERGSISNIFIGSFIAAHLVIVFFRSHANKEIFKLYPYRFKVVPIVLFISLLLSKWLLIAVGVLAIWWDVYHSSMQTFGLGRIYDMRRKNNLHMGRTLDKILNFYLYTGPVLSGVSLLFHLDNFDDFRFVGSVFFTSIPMYVESRSQYLAWFVVVSGSIFLLYYLYAYWRFSKKGYHVSFQKVLLLLSTGICSIYTWGFNTFGEAFFIMNFFHALQYFALVWWAENKNMVNTFHLGGVPWGKPIALVLYLAFGFSYGFIVGVSPHQSTLVISIILVVTIMHFWYDGFIWSVQKKQIN